MISASDVPSHDYYRRATTSNFRRYPRASCSPQQAPRQANKKRYSPPDYLIRQLANLHSIPKGPRQSLSCKVGGKIRDVINQKHKLYTGIRYVPTGNKLHCFALQCCILKIAYRFKRHVFGCNKHLPESYTYMQLLIALPSLLPTILWELY
jgi:hypothetical protein